MDGDHALAAASEVHHRVIFFHSKLAVALVAVEPEAFGPCVGRFFTHQHTLSPVLKPVSVQRYSGG
jgi:hypothetical protein